MNKKLLAVAVAGALAAPGLALAQAANVQIYGFMDNAALNLRYSGNSATTVGSFSKYDVFNASPSRLGFRGSEDLGNGMKAWFQAETTIFSEGRVPEATNPAGLLGARNTAVGLEGGWGNFSMGIWDAPYKAANIQTWVRGGSGPMYHGGMIMNNGDTTGAAPNAQCAALVSPATGGATGIGSTNALGATCPNQVEGNGTSFHRRMSNIIQYWSPVWSGFQAKIATQINEGKTPGSLNAAGTNNNTQPSLWSYSLTWANGPWNAGAAYEQHKGYNGNTASVDPNTKDSAWMLGGGWNFGPGTIAGGWERLTYGDNSALGGVTANGFTRTNWVLNGTFKIGAAGMIWAGYSKTPGGRSCGDGATGGVGYVVGAAAVCGSNSAASNTTLGYDHSMSKRTTLYAVYGRINNSNGTSYYYIAAPNGPNGVSSVLTPGTDVSTLGVGIRHTF
ncbi:MAG: porin [Betaproteobacteria bacterium]|nr:porin [Betaproteobacteria bacterium]